MWPAGPQPADEKPRQQRAHTGGKRDMRARNIHPHHRANQPADKNREPKRHVIRRVTLADRSTGQRCSGFHILLSPDQGNDIAAFQPGFGADRHFKPAAQNVAQENAPRFGRFAEFSNAPPHNCGPRDINFKRHRRDIQQFPVFNLSDVSAQKFNQHIAARFQRNNITCLQDQFRARFHQRIAAPDALDKDALARCHGLCLRHGFFGQRRTGRNRIGADFNGPPGRCNAGALLGKAVFFFKLACFFRHINAENCRAYDGCHQNHAECAEQIAKRIRNRDMADHLIALFLGQRQRAYRFCRRANGR